MVDAADYEWLNQWRWVARWNRFTRSHYAVRSAVCDGHRQTVYMSRLILNLGMTKRLYGDHIDGNTLNNTRANLRIATFAQNQHNRGPQRNNTSGFKGVAFHKDSGKWVAYIGVDGRKRHLGLRDTPEKAYALYCEAAKIYHGEFAKI